MRALGITFGLVAIAACSSTPEAPVDPSDFVLGIKDSPACALACDPT